MEQGSAMGTMAVVVMGMMLIMCANECQATDIFVSSAGSDVAETQHVQTIQYALDRDLDEVAISLAPERFELTERLTTTIRNVTIRGWSQSGTVLASVGGDRVLFLHSFEVVYFAMANMTIRDGNHGVGGCLRINGRSSARGFAWFELANVTMMNCTADDTGGALHLGSGTHLRIANCAFVDNDASLLAGVFWAEELIEIVDSVFVNNTSQYASIALVAGEGDEFIVDGCYFGGNSQTGSGIASLSNLREAALFTVRNTIMEDETSSSAFRSLHDLTMQDVEVRNSCSFDTQPVDASHILTVERTLMAGSQSGSDRGGLRGSNVTLDDVVFDSEDTDIIVEPQGAADGVLSVTGLVRNNGACFDLFNIRHVSSNDGTNNVAVTADVVTADLCGDCDDSVAIFSAPGANTGTFVGTIDVDDVTIDGSNGFGTLTFDSPACPVTPLCGSGVFSLNEDGVCRHATLETELQDCMGVLGGNAFVDLCDECVSPCAEGEFYIGDCGSRTCVATCGGGLLLDTELETCATCSGPMSCVPGQLFFDCNEWPVNPARRVCVDCPSGTYENSGVCVPCTFTQDNCNGVGFAAGGCEPRATSDNSTCTNCTALGSFVSSDGRTCTGGCDEGSRPVGGTESMCEVCAACPADEFPSVVCTVTEEHVCSPCTGPTSCGAGEGLVACGPESTDVGMRECVTCPVGTYGNGNVCLNCTFAAADCSEAGLVFFECGEGSTSDVSTCTNCTAMSMFVSGDGATCTGGCVAGEVPVVGAPGEMVCNACPDNMYQEGPDCILCAHDAGNCNEAGLVLQSCGLTVTSDVSTCTNCTAMGMFVSGDGGSCTGGCNAGEVPVAGAPGEMVCNACPDNMYQEGPDCILCAHDAGNCNEAGLVLQSCGLTATSDVSTCTNCTAMSMFVSGDGGSCTGGCNAGEVPVAGAPGEAVCDTCAVDTYENGTECVACAHTAAACNDTELAFVGCPGGGSSDVSACTNCTMLGLPVASNGMMCAHPSNLRSGSGVEDEELSGGGIAGVVIGVVGAVVVAFLVLRGTKVRKRSVCHGVAGVEEMITQSATNA